MSQGDPQTTLEQSLLADLGSMSDNQLIDRAARYNAELRRGRKMADDGNALVAVNINLFVMCQNELHSRTMRKIDHETDRALANG